MSRLLVLGDVHGAVRALDQVLERAEFSGDDRLVFLGDAVDGWPDTREVLSRLCSIPNLVYVIGNHDRWFRSWYADRWHDAWEMVGWLQQGGEATQRSYGNDPRNVPPEHRDLLDGAAAWHVDDGRVFVHGGWRYEVFDHPAGDDPENLCWDRGLWSTALWRQRNHDRYGGAEGVRPALTRWREVYVGHTTTSEFSDRPVHACEVWNMDQGAGWGGRLSLMDVDTKQVWQSDLAQELYLNSEKRS